MNALDTRAPAKAAVPLPYLSKPRYGEACNGCGLCCSLSLCQVALTAFGYTQKAPCPALEYHDGRSWCGFVLAEKNANVMPLIHHGLGIGEGCGMDDAETVEEMLEWS